MKKTIIRTLIGLAVVALLAFWALFLSPRPPLTTDPATLAGDGSLVNYCELPLLDGSGKMAADIPKGNTPRLNVKEQRWENKRFMTDSGNGWIKHG